MARLAQKTSLIIALFLAALWGCSPKGGVSQGELKEAATKPVSFAELAPLTAPAKSASLVMGAVTMSVTLESKAQTASALSFQLMTSSGDAVESESYSVGSGLLQLDRTSDDEFKPGLAIAQDGKTSSEPVIWSGKWISGGVTHDATAKATLRYESLDFHGKPTMALVSEVALSTQSGGPQPAVRKLTFWIIKGSGIVKREFGMGSARMPRDDEPSTSSQ